MDNLPGELGTTGAQDAALARLDEVAFVERVMFREGELQVTTVAGDRFNVDGYGQVIALDKEDTNG